MANQSPISINYIIATYEGVSMKREKHDDENGIILQKHMKVLCESLKSTKHITQVTIIKPSTQGEIYKNYYDIDKYITEIENIGIKVVICDTKISFKSSYAQYCYAYCIFPNFDHYIIMEDDWVPFPKTYGFDDILLNTYKASADCSGFHSTWATRWFNGLSYLPRRSAISVGIISNDSFKTIISTYKARYGKRNTIVPSCPSPYSWLDQCIHQTLFSDLFTLSSLPLTDYTNEGKDFMNPFWITRTGRIREHAQYENTKYLIVPIQFLKLEKYRYIKGTLKQLEE